MQKQGVLNISEQTRTKVHKGEQTRTKANNYE